MIDSRSLIEEVERQTVEYGLSTNDAVENVADAIGESWQATWDAYWAAKDAQ